MKIVLVARVLIKKLTHIGITKKITKTLPYFNFAKKKAIGYPITKQSTEVINPTSKEFPNIMNEELEVKNNLKFSPVSLLLSSKKAETNIRHSGNIININMKTMYG